MVEDLSKEHAYAPTTDIGHHVEHNQVAMVRVFLEQGCRLYIMQRARKLY